MPSLLLSRLRLIGARCHTMFLGWKQIPLNLKCFSCSSVCSGLFQIFAVMLAGQSMPVTRSEIWGILSQFMDDGKLLCWRGQRSNSKCRGSQAFSVCSQSWDRLAMPNDCDRHRDPCSITSLSRASTRAAICEKGFANYPPITSRSTCISARNVTLG